MANEILWDKPNNFTAVFRCTTKQYADNFLKRGEIKFNTPESWVKYAEEVGEGRGDFREGTLAFYHKNDIENMKLINYKFKTHEPLLRYRVNDRVYLKKARDMELPCFCFYILKQENFHPIDGPIKEGWQTLSKEVPSSYFTDFTDNLEIEKIEQLEEKDKPAVVIIKDYSEFENRVITTLLKLGIERQQIISTTVAYLDFNQYGKEGYLDFGIAPPKQLAIKHTRFKDQSEARIIINTFDEKIKNILKKPIEIGSLEDIAECHNAYFHKGIRVDMKADVYLVDKD